MAKRSSKQGRSRLTWMLLMGLALAVALLIVLEVLPSIRPGSDDPSGSTVSTEAPPDPNLAYTPPVFRLIAEQAGKFRITGTSEPDAVISVLDRGQRLRQIRADGDGNWASLIDITPDAVMAIDLEMYLETGPKIRADETVLYVPGPKADTLEGEDVVFAPASRALILVTAPGGPSRVVQSPFSGQPSDGPLSMGPVDYDDSGGVIFSGTSALPGRVRIYGDEAAIGETQVSGGGRWFFIAGDTLPRGPYAIAAELITEGGVNSRVEVSFTRLSPERPYANGLPYVEYESGLWQIRRTIAGGGTQSTAIFAPLPVEE